MLESTLYQEDLKKINEADFPWEKLEGRNVLVTGGTGLIGSCFVDTLIWRNEHMGARIGIWVLCRHKARAKEVFGGYLEKEYFHLILQDVSEPLLQNAPAQSGRNGQNVSDQREQNASEPACREIPDSMDYIVHAASKGDPKSFVTDPLGVMNANMLGMHWILEYARRAKPEKILYLSSGEAYGTLELPEDVPILETMTGLLDSLNVRNCYGISKRAAETMCVSAAYEYQLPVCIARLCHTYGPTMMKDENRVIFQFIANALRGEDIVLKSAGTQRRSYCYVADAVRGLLAILFYGKTGEAYNVSNSRSVVTIKELAEYLSAYAGCRVRYEGQTEAESRGNSGIMHAVLDDRKLLELGVRMEYDMEAGLKRTMEVLGQLNGGVKSEWKNQSVL